MDPGAPRVQRRLTDHEDPVRRQFTQPHIYYLGSHSHCGLGAARRIGPAQLFVCWDGNYAVTPGRRLRLTAGELEAAADWTQELTFVEILAADAPPLP